MNLSLIARRCEFTEPTKYNGKGEFSFAVIGCLIWFAAIVVRLSFGSQSWTLTEKLIEATSFVVFAGIPVFFGATIGGSKFAQAVLLKQAGLLFQAGICGLLAGYILLVKLLNLNPDRFKWLNRLDDLILTNQFWLNTLFLLIGVFVVLRIPFLLLKLRDRPPSLQGLRDLPWIVKQNSQLVILLVINFIYVSLVNTSLVAANAKSENSGFYIGFSYFLIFILMQLPIVKRTSPSRLMVFDILLSTACIGSLFWFSKPFFSFGVFIGIDLFILAVIYGSGLGREHFGYSFQSRSRDIRYLIKTLVVAAVILIPVTYLMRFNRPEFSALVSIQGLNQIPFFLSYAVLFSFRVGIFEEILFRSGLMIFIRDQLQESTQNRIDRQTLLVASVIICSVIFGLCHIGNLPRSGSLLSPVEYKLVYALLATIASLFYSIAFGETNRLWCSIIIHGTVDTTAVLLLGASLTVPF